MTEFPSIKKTGYRSADKNKLLLGKPTLLHPLGNQKIEAFTGVGYFYANCLFFFIENNLKNLKVLVVAFSNSLRLFPVATKITKFVLRIVNRVCIKMIKHEIINHFKI